MLYGVFFEDINYAVDGGLYGEMVQNRSFEFAGADALAGWSLVERGNPRGSMSIETDRPWSTNNPHYVRMQVGDAGEGIGLANFGYGGMVIQEGSNYVFSICARAVDSYSGQLTVQLEGSAKKGKTVKNEVLGEAQIVGLNQTWQKCTSVIKATKTDTNAHLVVIAHDPGTIDVDMISLFPEHTFKEHQNGLRADLAQMVAGLKPSFVRFPGGCIVEGKDLANRYEWKDTIGDVADRKANWNRWQSAHPESPAPQYYQSYGLGFFEYFQFCEDIGAEPLPVINCGMSCQFQDNQLVALQDLDPYVQDALDLIEFANGSASSPWGAKRAQMGHPEPFHMKYIGIGNEQWGEDYFTRYERFATAIKTKYPEIQIVSSAGAGPDGKWFDMAWPRLRSLNADIVDEHYYRTPSWFLSHADRYDSYDRNGPKVFAGEYAARTASKRNTIEAALAEAAFMTGLERDSDVVAMASYAPLFARAGYTQCPVNLIWFNKSQMYGSPSYYVQQLFSTNRGDVVLTTDLEDGREVKAAAGRIALGTYHTDAEFKEVRVAKGSKTLFSADFKTDALDWKTTGGTWTIRDGKYHQTDTQTVSSSAVGDSNWSDYTLTLKARKLGGDEGFVIGVRNCDDGSQVQWNLGGWGNQQHGIQVIGGGGDKIVDRVPGNIEADRWYDVKITLKGTRISCYLNGALVQTADVPIAKSPRLFVTASREQEADKIILKVVNPTSEAASARVRLPGLERIGSKGEAIVLAGENPGEENSFALPTKVAPVTVPLTGVSSQFSYKFKPYSVTVLRIDAER